MRKVHTDLIAKLEAHQTGRVSANTRIVEDECNAGTLLVQLHGNTIAALHAGPGNHVELFDAGWTSNTTKDRLNTILDRFAPGYGISQKGFAWRLLCGLGQNSFPVITHTWGGSAAFKRGQWMGAAA